MSTGPLHLNTLIHNIISLLKRYDDGLTFEKLKSLLNLDVLSSPELTARLKNNPRIIFTDARLIYRPQYTIKNLEELLQYFKSHTSDPGILLSELKESFKAVDTELSSSPLRAHIYRISITDHVIIYYNPVSNVKPAPDDVRSLWNSFNATSLNLVEG